METEEKRHSDFDKNHCKLKYYEGSLFQFASNLLTRRRGDGSVCRICEISSAIISDMLSKGLKLQTKDIIITQRQVFKYMKHPKTNKGANIPLEDYAFIETALKNPSHIYADTVQKHLVYVCTLTYCFDKLVKVVVEPNYRSHGVVINVAKSWGIVEKSKMKGIQYRQIQ